MWVCSKYGFYSIVQSGKDIQVRGREEVDLKNLVRACQLNKKIIETEQADYRFRVIVTPRELEDIMLTLADSVDYPNFKSMIDTRPDQKNKPYHDVWGVLADALGCYGGKKYIPFSPFTDNFF